MWGEFSDRKLENPWVEIRLISENMREYFSYARTLLSKDLALISFKWAKGN